jgi:putative effector of murein hydrolase
MSIANLQLLHRIAMASIVERTSPVAIGAQFGTASHATSCCAMWGGKGGSLPPVRLPLPLVDNDLSGF